MLNAQFLLPLGQARPRDGIQRNDRAGAANVGERLGVAHAAGDQECAGGERGTANTGVAVYQHRQLIGMRGLDKRNRRMQLFDQGRMEIRYEQAQHPIRRRAVKRIFALGLKAQHRADAQRMQRRPLPRAKLAADK